MDYSKLDKIKVLINGKEFNLLVMKTEEEKEFGAKGVTKLDKGEGFFFDFRDNPQEELAFWMEDTEIPLTIAFVNDEDVITNVYKGEPFSLEYLEGYNVAYVLEVSDKEELKVGEEVEIIENDFDLPKNEMLLLNADGSVQFKLQGGERIFSRVATKVIIRKAKKAFKTKEDSDYKALGRYIFKELEAQENRDPQYVEK